MNTPIEPAALNDFYRGIYDLLGAAALLKLHEQYRGMQITIPIHLYDRQRVAERLPAQYNGHNSYALARKYGYSQRWVTQTINKSK
ncbi:Mor transcription activator family protein [Lactiplantibacillus plajomi]|uniref:Mor transcription activator family protein n=1 Tax=Lactiplantibacillus plajomi TaxID=1457217 RepID=A0ABV6K6J2_9LACO|nr:Mor transcription activator family protein [Lactiplantibacillus plajomi]